LASTTHFAKTFSRTEFAIFPAALYLSITPGVANVSSFYSSSSSIYFLSFLSID